MLLLQFSTSHYCRKARLALGYKGVSYQVENLTPGLHTLKLKPLTGLTTVSGFITPNSRSTPGDRRLHSNFQVFRA
ncbi:MAG: glutathione S-transferase N-terminal domain-containing protein [Planktothrix sp. GU0601_MAG3]|nr:MAG: glutathione S-transferase N-terminal domain-containing protein [Planktothrix sp. GU0601_MAG3]